MRAIIQRVQAATVQVDTREVGSIKVGFFILLGVATDDTETDATWMADRIAGLRIMADESGKMNRTLKEASGSILLVSQFTLHADVRSGRRPSFLKAARPELAQPLYERVRDLLRSAGVQVETGEFGSYMTIPVVNDGPTTIFIDSKEA